MRPHCFILTEACSCRLKLTYFARKIYKSRLVCKKAVALAYYGSCRLLVMGSCSWPIRIHTHTSILHKYLCTYRKTKTHVLRGAFTSFLSSRCTSEDILEEKYPDRTKCNLHFWCEARSGRQWWTTAPSTQMEKKSYD